MPFFILLMLFGAVIFVVSIVASFEDQTDNVRLVALVVFALGFFGFIGHSIGEDEAKKEAVKNKVAYYEQIVAEDGSVTNKFVWGVK